MRWFGQELFEMAVETRDRASYDAARAQVLSLAREAVDGLLGEHDVQFLVAPTTGPAWNSDLVLGDRFDDSIGVIPLPAIAGYPHLTVPMGAVESQPVGLGIFGARWNDHGVLKAGAAYESARTAELPEPSFERWQPPD
jgi:amidase